MVIFSNLKNIYLYIYIYILRVVIITVEKIAEYFEKIDDRGLNMQAIRKTYVIHSVEADADVYHLQISTNSFCDAIQ